MVAVTERRDIRGAGSTLTGQRRSQVWVNGTGIMPPKSATSPSPTFKRKARYVPAGRAQQPLPATNTRTRAGSKTNLIS